MFETLCILQIRDEFLKTTQSFNLNITEIGERFVKTPLIVMDEFRIIPGFM